MPNKDDSIAASLAALPPRQKFTVSSTQHTYSYIHISSITPSKHTLLFLHGFPSHIPDWINQIAHFSHCGYGVLVPELLGYGQSSSPEDPSDYRYKPMSTDLVALLDHLNLQKVIGVGHDFGAMLLSRFVAFYTERFAGAVFLSVGAPKMASRHDLAAINAATKEQMGFEFLGYQVWLSDLDSGADKAMEKNTESEMSLVFAADYATLWHKRFHPTGEMKKFIENDERVRIGDWYPQELQKAHLENFGRDGALRGAQRWYTNMCKELSLEDEKPLEDFVLDIPTLFIGDDSDHGRMCEGWLKEWVKNVKSKLVKTGHWVQLERKEVVNEDIETFLSNI